MVDIELQQQKSPLRNLAGLLLFYEVRSEFTIIGCVAELPAKT
jgi:hypothetical protein